MNMNEIKARLTQIEAAKDDSEIAHGLEDLLHEDFIKSIAEDETNPQCFEARLVLTAANIKFNRWYA